MIMFEYVFEGSTKNSARSIHAKRGQSNGKQRHKSRRGCSHSSLSRSAEKKVRVEVSLSKSQRVFARIRIALPRRIRIRGNEAQSTARSLPSSRRFIKPSSRTHRECVFRSNSLTATLQSTFEIRDKFSMPVARVERGRSDTSLKADAPLSNADNLRRGSSPSPFHRGSLSRS